MRGARAPMPRVRPPRAEMYVPEPCDGPQLDLTDQLLNDLGDPAVRMLAVWAEMIVSTPCTELDIDIDTALAAIKAGKTHGSTHRDNPHQSTDHGSAGSD